ncbi:MAG: alpha/beta fold hydrolase [Rhodospirillales bacterium]
MTWTTRQRSDYPGGIAGVRAGDGKPLVLIHGVGLNADSWGTQIDVLSGEFSVHALDLPGHGNSAPVADPAIVSDFSDALAAAFGAVEKPFFLAGHSLGALIALDIAVRYPETCRAVAALNAVHRRGPEALAAVRARANAMSATEVNDPVPTLSRWYGDDLDGAAAQACRRWLTSVDPAAYKAAYTVFADADSPADEAMTSLGCPALFLTGGLEPNSTPAMSEAMAAMVPDGRSVIVPGAAHMAMMTHATAVNRALSDFFGGAS